MALSTISPRAPTYSPDTYKDGDKLYESWEEGSLKEYTYKTTGGTGKYQGASGGGTYFYENLTVTLATTTPCFDADHPSGFNAALPVADAEEALLAPSCP